MSEERPAPGSETRPEQDGQEPALADTVIDVGQRLRLAREARGISIDEASMAIKLGPRQVEALEANDWSQLPRTVTRGFVRNYARYLELDAALLMEALDHAPMPQGPELVVGVGSPVSMPHEAGYWRDYVPVLAGVIILALALLAFFFVPAETWQSSIDLIKMFVSEKKAVPEIIVKPVDVSGNVSVLVQATPVEEAPVVVTSAVGKTPVTATPVSVTPVASKVPVAPAPVPDEVPVPMAPSHDIAPTLTLTPTLNPVPDVVPTLVPVPVSTPVSTQTPILVPTPPAPTEPERSTEIPAESSSSDETLFFSFDQPSWVEVRDRGGRIVFSQLNQAGSQREVAGRSPFSVVIGNASHVMLQYKGKSVDLSRRSKDDVVRLTIE
jgi:cytoskeleton protein RodZ